MIRLSDIAREAGVSTFTVSCALRGQGRVAEDTAMRIRELAAKMGYQPSAAARALAAGRKRSHDTERDLLVAIVHFGKRPGNSALSGRRTQQMMAIARQMGYLLEMVYLQDFESPAHMSRVLWARGVVGLIFHTVTAPLDMHVSDLDGLEFNRYSIIKISRGIDSLRCHCIRLSAFSHSSEALRRIVEAGYKRIGVLMLERSASTEDDYARVGAVTAFQYFNSSGVEAIELLRMKGPLSRFPKEAEDWLARVKPDVILGFPAVWRVWMEMAGYRFPEDMAFVGLPVVPAAESQTGVSTSGPLDDFLGQMFPTALKMLHEEIAIGRKGLPPIPYEYVLPVLWQEGVTMPSKAAG